MCGVLANVSRETVERLGLFSDLVLKWTPRINLISKSTVDQIWDRHILDSSQIHSIAPHSGKWLDLGSGGGFPGIVAAILSQDDGFSHDFTFIESDKRKCVFLRTALRELGLNGTVIADRIENVAPVAADILTARALTDLSGLLAFSEQHMKKSGISLFPKGESWEKEDSLARETWSYSSEAVMSQTNPKAAILKIKDVLRV